MSGYKRTITGWRAGLGLLALCLGLGWGAAPVLGQALNAGAEISFKLAPPVRSMADDLPAPAAKRPSQDTLKEQTITRVVHPLFYATLPDGKETGGFAELTVRLAPSDAGDVRIGFFESEFFGAGPQWRASGWMAGLVSALITGQPLSQWRISYDVADQVDGPSAGGLITSSVLSAMLGAPIKDDVTMTGTINPDGSIGPVGGIYFKLEGAKSAKAKKVLIPMGQRMEKQADGKTADLVARGRELGLEVVEVADVSEAYSHLTGQRLPQAADDGRALEMPAQANQALVQSYHRWRQKFEQAVAKLKEVAPRVPKEQHATLDKFWNESHKVHAKAVAIFQKNQYAPAMQLMFNAATGADAAAHLALLYAGYGQGGLDGMKKVFKDFVITKEFLVSFLSKLVNQPLKSVSDLITVAEAFAYYDAALGVHLNTTAVLLKLPEVKEEKKIVQVLEGAALSEAMARNFFHFVDDLLHMGLGYAGPAVPPAERLAVWSRGMYQTAGANLGYIEKAIIDPTAKGMGVAGDLVKNKLMGMDFHYGLAQTIVMAVPRVLKAIESEQHAAAAVLGGAAASFSLSSLVVAKYYCLGADLNPTGMVTSLEKPQHLLPMLRSSHRELRQTILKAQAAGNTPIIPLFHLVSAEALARQSEEINDRLLCLSEQWAGSTFGRLMVIFSQPPAPLPVTPAAARAN